MAAEVNKPDFSYQWASGGAIVTPSNVKIQTGWTPEVPPFQWENYLQNRQDNAIVHLFQKGISEWDAASNYYFTTGGVRSYVQGSDGLIYVAVADSIGQNPTTDVSDIYWKLAFAPEVPATTAIQGIVQLATNAQMATGTSTSLVPSVAAVMSLFSKRVFTTADYIRIPDVPGGLIIQWASGVSTTVPAGGSTTQDITFPIAFPSGIAFGLQSNKYVSGSALSPFESPTGLTGSKVNITVGNPTPAVGTAIPRILYLGY